MIDAAPPSENASRPDSQGEQSSLASAAVIGLMEKLARGAAETTEIGPMLNLALTAVCRALDWPLAHAYVLAERDPPQLKSAGAWHVTGRAGFADFQHSVESQRLVSGEGLAGRAMGRQRAEWIADTDEDPAFPDAAVNDALGRRAAVAVPVVLRDRVVAVLEFFAPAPQPVNNELVRVLVLVANQVARVFERVWASDALTTGDRLLSAFLDNTPMAAISWDMNMIVTGWNKAAVAIFGFGEDEALGRQLGDLLVPDSARIQVAEVVGALLARQGGNHSIHENRTKDGRIIVCEWFNSLLEDANGRTTGGTSLVQDVTRLNKTTEALNKVQEDAASLSMAKSGFLSTMGHELRAPLNIVTGFGHLLKMDERNPLTETQLDSVDQMLEASDHLLQVIDGVVELAKLEGRKLQFKIRNLDLNDIFDACLTTIRPLAQARDITLDAPPPASIRARVSADPQKLEEVLTHLLFNAVKYNRDGGFVSLTVEDVGDNLMRIAVNDTGPGIPETLRERLFEPFDRLGRDASHVRGTGLGLAICRQIMQQMNGQIGFDSMPDHGSLFWIEIPLSGSQTAIQPTDETVEPLSRPPTRDTGEETTADAASHLVLYVEDNSANLALMTRVVTALPDVDMISARTAELGIALAQSRQPDVILMDINLPGMDGFDALERLRWSESTRHIPVIAVSAQAGSHAVAKGLRAGFDAYLTKPINIAATQDALRKALGM